MGAHISYLAAIAALLVILGLVLDAWRQAARGMVQLDFPTNHETFTQEIYDAVEPRRCRLNS